MTKPLPLQTFGHLALTTSRVFESTAFYRDVLGFREIDRPNFNFDGSWLAQHNMILHLVHNPDAGLGEHKLRSRVNHFALHTDDLESVVALLDERGIEYRRSQLADTEIEQVYFLDPDGHQIEVGNYPAHMLPAGCKPQ